MDMKVLGEEQICRLYNKRDADSVGSATLHIPLVHGRLSLRFAKGPLLDLPQNPDAALSLRRNLKATPHGVVGL
jgi:hypothetical protein